MAEPVGVAAPPAVAALQRRTLGVLASTQIVGGIGVTIGITVGALLAARIGGTTFSGLAGAAMVVGAAVLAVPVSRVMQARGRRPGLVLAYAVGCVGAVVTVGGAAADSLVLLLLGLAAFGGGTAANLQARYAAVDLADPGRRGRHLSLIVWATTIGSVAAPQFATLADEVMGRVGLPRLTGPFAFSAIAFAVCALALFALLRPDPLLLARRLVGDDTDGGTPAPAPAASGGLRAGLRTLARIPAARLGIAAVATGHVVMVGVMSMTPVHIGEFYADDVVLGIVGVVLSVHIAGMYALSPVAGWLTDRYGRRPVILGGIGLLLAACLVSGTAGHDMVRLSIGLALLGLGWSGTMVAGSTLLSESVPVAGRPAAQGLSDLVMGLAGASAAALSGPVVGFFGYPTLTAVAAVAAVPLIALALSRPAPTPA